MTTKPRQDHIKEQGWKFKLYVVNESARSVKALANLEKVCETYLEGRYQLEVIDLQANPEVAQQEQILVIPTLVREKPQPILKIIGDLWPPEKVVAALELDTGGSSGKNSLKSDR